MIGVDKVSIVQKSLIRMQNMLKMDKKDLPISLIKELKTELFLLLKQYFEIDLKDLEISYFINDKNQYEVDMKFRTSRLKNCQFM